MFFCQNLVERLTTFLGRWQNWQVVSAFCRGRYARRNHTILENVSLSFLGKCAGSYGDWSTGNSSLLLLDVAVRVLTRNLEQGKIGGSVLSWSQRCAGCFPSHCGMGL
jgi:hypothetical protein